VAIELRIGADKDNPIYTFTRTDIRSRSLQVSTALDIVGSELAYDVLYAEVDYAVGEYLWFSPADYDGVMTSDGYIFAASDQTSDITVLPYGTPVWVVEGSTVRHKMFFEKAEQIDPRTFSLKAVSGVGLLERRRHLGGLYTGQTVTAVLAELIGDAFPWTAEQTAAGQRVYGLLLADTARANLHKLMYALGLSLTKSAAGAVHFDFITDAVAGTIPGSRIYLGGTVEYRKPATAVEVTEHSFYQLSGTEAETLFDNAGEPAAENTLVEFDGAYYDFTVTGNLSIVESRPTYAILSGTGTLTGIPYVHNTRVVRLEGAAAAEENVIKSDKDTLVGSLNALSVAERLLAYYSCRKIVHLPVVLAGERAGQNVSFADPYGGNESGFILNAESTITGIEKANLKILAGYTPTGQGNYYTKRIAVTASGTVTIPAEHIRIVLIQGGTGGQGGYKGEDGLGGDKPTYGGDLTPYGEYPNTIGYHYSGGSQGIAQGGAPGEPGEPGKILVIDINVVSGSTATITVGAGGIGGATEGGLGSEGGETTISIGGALYSSAEGVRGTIFPDPITGDVYCAPGAAGHRGGNGGLTDVESLFADNGADGRRGEDVWGQIGGLGGGGYKPSLPYPQQIQIFASGGGGGGAAYGAAGYAGGSGTFDSSGAEVRVLGGPGGRGANAVKPAAPGCGTGGGGGNGGGAGGNGGGGHLDHPGFTEDGVAPGDGGEGGSGSQGGDGGTGGCYIFY